MAAGFLIEKKKKGREQVNVREGFVWMDGWIGEGGGCMSIFVC